MMKIALAVLLSALVPIESWADACYKKCSQSTAIINNDMACDVGGCWWDINGDGLLAAPESYMASEEITDALEVAIDNATAAAAAAQAAADAAQAAINALPPGSSSTSAMSGDVVPGQTHIRENGTPTSSQFCWASDPAAEEKVCVTGTAVP